MKYTVLTFGCQMNVSDSERINTILNQAGFEHEPDMKKTDLVIMNTCSVKQKAEDKVWGQVHLAGKMKRENPNVRVGLTGCMVRESGVRNSYDSEGHSKDKLFRSSPVLDFVFRIEDLAHVPKYLSTLYEEEIGTDYNESLESYFEVRPEYAKSFQVFVPVQTGCNKFCTYCIVPFTRNREISRPMQEIIDETRDLVEKGAKEVTLLGQTVNSYKHPESTSEYSENNFAELLYHLQQLEGLERIRYTSPHPMDMHDELIRAHVELDKVCNHIHLPMQSGSTEVLKRMNRKYSRERYLEVAHKIKDAIPDISITTDIIVGFPGETEEEFQETVEAFKEMKFDMSFTSRYSERTGTYAAKKLPDDITPDEKSRRWHVLNDLLKEISLERNKSFENKYYTVLVEKRLDDGRYEGFTTNYKRVQFHAKSQDLIGKIIPVKIERGIEFVLFGTALEK